MLVIAILKVKSENEIYEHNWFQFNNTILVLTNLTLLVAWLFFLNILS